MKFRNLIEKITFKKLKLSGQFKYQEINGKLKTIIYVEDVETDQEDITTMTSFLEFEDNSWDIEIKYPSIIDSKKLKKIVTKEIESMISKIPTADEVYFSVEDDGTLEVEKDAEYIIALPNSII